MANSEAMKVISMVAAADLSAKQFLFLKATSTGANVAGAGERAIGVQQSGSSAVAGQPVAIAVEGVAKVKVGTGPIAVGVQVKSDANGAAVAASSSDKMLGISVDTASRATGDYVEILLTPGGVA